MVHRTLYSTEAPRSKVVLTLDFFYSVGAVFHVLCVPIKGSLVKSCLLGLPWVYPVFFDRSG